MKKTAFISLLGVALLLTGCDADLTKVKKPTFASFGDEVAFEDFKEDLIKAFETIDFNQEARLGSKEMKIKKYIFVVLGCICLGLGTVGVFLPILPTTPFYLLTVFFFANNSQKLHDWFLGTELYQKHLESFVKGRGMMLSTKISIISTVTLLMGFGFFMMARKGLWIPCVILAIVWLAHILYFLLRVKTLDP